MLDVHMNWMFAAHFDISEDRRRDDGMPRHSLTPDLLGALHETDLHAW